MKKISEMAGFFRGSPLRLASLVYVFMVMLVVIYYAFVASDMYVASAKLTVRGADSQAMSAFGALLTGVGGSSVNDAYVVSNYIHSRDLLDELDRRFDLKTMYSPPEADVFSRLSPEATPEEMAEYFQDVFTLIHEPDSHIMTLTVRAYKAEDAQRIAEYIIESSERLVNMLSIRAQEDALRLAKQEIAHAEERVMASRLQIKQFRDARGNIDPEAATKSIISIIGGLEEDLAKTLAELSEHRAYLREDSARIVSIKARINAIEEQIAREKRRLTGKEDDSLNELIHEYERLWIEREFAEKQYAAALSALEVARVEAEKQNRYLVAFVKPALAQEPLYPERAKTITIVLIGAILLYGILALVVAAVREHAGI